MTHRIPFLEKIRTYGWPIREVGDFEVDYFENLPKVETGQWFHRNFPSIGSARTETITNPNWIVQNHRRSLYNSYHLWVVSLKYLSSANYGIFGDIRTPTDSQGRLGPPDDHGTWLGTIDITIDPVIHEIILFEVILMHSMGIAIERITSMRSWIRTHSVGMIWRNTKTTIWIALTYRPRIQHTRIKSRRLKR